MILLTLKGKQSGCCVEPECMVPISGGGEEKKRETNQETSAIHQERWVVYTRMVVAKLVETGWILSITGIKDKKISSQNGCRV